MESGLEKGRPAPQWYIDQPEIAPGDDFYFDAFYELSTTRALGFGGAGPIPWQCIEQYAARSQLEAGMIPLFHRILRTMDNTYLGWVREQNEARMRANRDQDPKKKPPS